MTKLGKDNNENKFKLHVVTGLPRSGSTLMCNVLNQNPKFWATSTSSLPGLLSTIRHFWSASVEVRNMLEKDRKGTEEKMLRTMKAFMTEWHRMDGKTVIFDKSRAWSYNILMLKEIFHDAKIIVMVRDPRNVFASVEKQHRRTPLLEEAQNMTDLTLFNRASKMCAPDGLIGSPIRGIEDMLRRNPENKDVLYVKYENFSKNPKMVMQDVYTLIEEDYHEHNFDVITNTSIDPDGHYLFKYPHEGHGKIQPTDTDEYKKYMTNDIAGEIMKTFIQFSNEFGYN